MAETAKPAPTVAKSPYQEVVVHPLVLLSVVDHYRRVEEDDSEDKRVLGVLLGEHRKGRLDVTSSFAGTSSFRISRFPETQQLLAASRHGKTFRQI